MGKPQSIEGVVGPPGLGGIVVIHGRRGVGKSRVAATAVADVPHIYVSAASLPDREQRLLVLQSARRAGVPGVPEGDASWEDILVWLPRAGVGAIVFDGLASLLEANRRLLTELALTWRALEREGGAPTLVFVDEDLDVLRGVTGERSPFIAPPRAGVDASAAEVDFRRVEPGSFASVAARCPHWSADDVVAGYAIFGGLPARVRAIDPGQRLATNVVRLVLSPEGPLSSLPLEELRGRFQTASRYAAIVRALAQGARSWGDLGERIPDLRGAGPLAPYLKRLEALDLVRVRISLDAAAGGRRRRYALTDPFDRFWWSMVLPLRSAIVSGALDPERAWREFIEPRLTEHVARVYPDICRQYLVRYGLGSVRSKGREVGALWGDGYDIPVAGTLVSGAVVYGDCHWHERRPTAGSLDRLQQQIRATRYGVGREARIQVLFTREQPKERLRQTLLRSEWIQRVGPTEMVSVARQAAPGGPGPDS